MRAVVCLVLLPLLSLTCRTRPTYDETVADARACGANEPCVLAGAVPGCRCATAVRAGAKAGVDASARAERCAQPGRLYCPPLRNPRCENRICVADEIHE